MSERMATFVVLSGICNVAGVVERLAIEHAAFEPEHRRVMRSSDLNADCKRIAFEMRNDASVAAVLFNSSSAATVVLDAARAMSEAWIEYAFLRASRADR